MMIYVVSVILYHNFSALASQKNIFMANGRK